MPTSPIACALSSVAVARPVTFRNVAMFPLVAGTREHRAPDYRVLDDSLAAGLVEVTEVSAQGSVPELRVVNRGPDRMLIVDGEELVGARQNRVVNLTILVDAHSELTIPVSCVEAGRWRARSRAFSAAPRTQYSSGRAKRMAQATASMASAGRHHSDQSEVWADIAEMSARLKSKSATGAMEALFVDNSAFIDECVSACRPAGGQAGALFAVGRRVIGFDLFESPDVLVKLLPKLVRGVAVDALGVEALTGLSAETSSSASIASMASAEEFVEAVRRAPGRSCPAVGLGEDLRLTASGLTGAALVLPDRVVHLTALCI